MDQDRAHGPDALQRFDARCVDRYQVLEIELQCARLLTGKEQLRHLLGPQLSSQSHEASIAVSIDADPAIHAGRLARPTPSATGRQRIDDRTLVGRLRQASPRTDDGAHSMW
jgi:hypothetical protein